MCVCVCGPPGLRRLPAIHALTSPQLEGRGSGVLLSLYLRVFVREKHLFDRLWADKVHFYYPAGTDRGLEGVCVRVCVCVAPFVCFTCYFSCVSWIRTDFLMDSARVF